MSSQFFSIFTNASQDCTCPCTVFVLYHLLIEFLTLSLSLPLSVGGGAKKLGERMFQHDNIVQDS